jgi:hypothetical protein
LNAQTTMSHWDVKMKNCSFNAARSLLGSSALQSLLGWLLFLTPTANAGVLDIDGPTGSGNFGVSVKVLMNGNVLVTDPTYSSSVASQIGAVYLYDSAGRLLKTITGSRANDLVGSGGVAILADGNFVISSPYWNSTGPGRVGAATWCPQTGCVDATVTLANSLVGTTMNDHVSSGGVVALSNGNYVVSSRQWNGGFGAATWGSGATGTVGAVSASNSLVGSSINDEVSAQGIMALSNGNYVVDSVSWSDASVASVGAVTWGDGTQGVRGEVSAANSLIGAQSFDQIGINGVTPLANGNYVVRSQYWTNASAYAAGSVTWGNGGSGTVGVVSAQNSLVGTQIQDAVGRDDVAALINGNYVVVSSTWNNGSVHDAGAVTWGDGSAGVRGPVSPANSLVGSQPMDMVGYGALGLTEGGHVVALKNGNYVVASISWANGTVPGVGAVTWANGATGIRGPVGLSNSLVGSSEFDHVGTGITALANGNFVVSSPDWANGSISEVGAVTWVNGATGLIGAVSFQNSLIGSSTADNVGGNTNPPVAPYLNGVAALSNGNYVVSSPRWNGGQEANGAVTWCDGALGAVGLITSTNSIVGTTAYEFVGSPVPVALTNGNYVFAADWLNSVDGIVGSVTWVSGAGPTSGTVSSSNSLTGTQPGDTVGGGRTGVSPYDGIVTLRNGNYVVFSPKWNNGAVTAAGAVTLGHGGGQLVGMVNGSNSVLGGAENAGNSLVYDYDVPRDQLVVGRPAENKVTILYFDQVFVNGFE